MASSALKALLAVLAVAGYQNRDKIGDVIRGLQNPRNDDTGPSQSGGLGGLLGGLTGGGGLGGLLAGNAGEGGIAGGLRDLLKQFQENGHGDTANSWVQTGPNAPIDDRQLSDVLGPDLLKDLAARTGLSPEEITNRLSRDLPAAVDDMTPDGSLPTEESHPGHPSVPSIKPQIV